MRLQTFPESYIVGGTLAEVQKQVGNAVPSLLGEVLAQAIRRQLLDESRVPTKLKLLPAAATTTPSAETPTSPATKYLKHQGRHAAHPGTGLGPGARSAAAE
jgi:DNA (cytosine-5)-methyltransferase 1